MFILGLILGMFIGMVIQKRLITHSKWIPYKHDRYVIINGIVIVRYRNGHLHVTRDHNAIDWTDVVEYRLI